MADICPKCNRYDPRNVHNLVSCSICTLRGADVIAGASGEEIERLKEKRKADKKKRKGSQSRNIA